MNCELLGLFCLNYLYDATHYITMKRLYAERLYANSMYIFQKCESYSQTILVPKDFENSRKMLFILLFDHLINLGVIQKILLCKRFQILWHLKILGQLETSMIKKMSTITLSQKYLKHSNRWGNWTSINLKIVDSFRI